MPDTRFPNVASKLLKHDPDARLVNSLEHLSDGVYRVGYIDSERKQWYWVYREEPLCS